MLVVTVVPAMGAMGFVQEPMPQEEIGWRPTSPPPSTRQAFPFAANQNEDRWRLVHWMVLLLEKLVASVEETEWALQD